MSIRDQNLSELVIVIRADRLNLLHNTVSLKFKLCDHIDLLNICQTLFVKIELAEALLQVFGRNPSQLSLELPVTRAGR